MRKRLIEKHLLGPTGVVFVVLVVIVITVILTGGGDPLELARIGTRFSQGDPDGTEGYDGQFVYYIARDPDPETVATYLDDPPYRYQRILLPQLGRLLSFGQPELIPWSLAIIGVLTQVLGTALLAEVLMQWGINRWYALTYGLWVGFTLAVRLDLPEPLAYGLVVAGILASERGRHKLSWLLYALALFAKEVTIVFLLAHAGYEFLSRRWSDGLSRLAFALIPYTGFQIWLWSVFGRIGLNSGGAMTTGFEWIPFMGIFRIGYYSVPFLITILVVYLPTLVIPTVWGIWMSIKNWIEKRVSLPGVMLLFNAVVMLFLPFSTYREPGGVLRFASGLILAILLYASKERKLKVLNYSFFWLVWNIILIKG